MHETRNLCAITSVSTVHVSQLYFTACSPVTLLFPQVSFHPGPTLPHLGHHTHTHVTPATATSSPSTAVVQLPPDSTLGSAAGGGAKAGAGVPLQQSIVEVVENVVVPEDLGPGPRLPSPKHLIEKVASKLPGRHGGEGQGEQRVHLQSRL